MAGIDPIVLDRCIADRAQTAFDFLERLVKVPSTVGSEQEAQELVAAQLERLGFQVERLSIAEAIDGDPHAGVPQGSYEGRYDLLARRGGPGPVLQLNGHVDVVPADEPELWSSPPFTPVRRDGWLYGRGAGDMKSGFAMALLALDALAAAAPLLDPPLSFASVIEEECTGNGTLAALRSGPLPAAAIALEPSDLDLLLGGIGILWAEIVVRGRHGREQAAADRSMNPVERTLGLVAALRELERELNDSVDDPVLAGVSHPYNLNLGVFRAGTWPSGVPSVARLGVRFGFPRGWSPATAEARLRETVAAAALRDPWLADHPPELRCTGFRAEGYALAADHPLAVAVADAHQEVNGSRPRPVTPASTSDARYYCNQFAVPALCYGPRARNIHGVDEAVELSSIVAGARALARLLAAWPLGGFDGQR
jgi:acetylornithine deacetylase